MTWVTLAAIAAAMLLVRRGWGEDRRLAVAGWSLGLAALALLGWAHGAWGLAVGTVAGTAVVAAILLHAAWTSPAKSRRPERVPPTLVLPRRWDDLGRRVAVFLLVVPLAFAAAQWFAYGLQALVRGAGAGASDTIVLTLFTQPLVWTILMAVQMTRSGPARMIAAPAVVALAGTLLWSLA